MEVSIQIKETHFEQFKTTSTYFKNTFSTRGRNTNSIIKYMDHNDQRMVSLSISMPPFMSNDTAGNIIQWLAQALCDSISISWLAKMELTKADPFQVLTMMQFLQTEKYLLSDLLDFTLFSRHNRRNSLYDLFVLAQRTCNYYMVVTQFCFSHSTIFGNEVKTALDIRLKAINIHMEKIDNLPRIEASYSIFHKFWASSPIYGYKEVTTKFGNDTLQEAPFMFLLPKDRY